MFLILFLGTTYTITYQNVSAVADDIISSVIEINSGTTNGPSLSNVDEFGSSVANIGDLNGDGTTDIAVGAINDDESGSNSGVVHIMFMNSDGTVSKTIEINGNTTNGPSLSNGDNFGSSVANIGDLNGDGVTDIAVGAINDDESGTDSGVVHIMFMNSDGTVSKTIEINSGTTNGPSLSDGDKFGSSVANIGDLNGDGTTDIAVGAIYDDESGSNSGVVHIMFMNSDGTVSKTIEINSGMTNGPVFDEYDQFGSSVANIGDLNGDGVTDIAVGADRDSSGGTHRGSIHVLFMNSDGTVSKTIKINHATTNGPVVGDFDYFGSSVANIGDLNEDGVTDIAVGALGDDVDSTQQGSMYIILLNDNGTVLRSIKIDSPTFYIISVDTGDSFGASIANIGDLNGDGTSDVAVGAIGDNIGGLVGGAIHILFMNGTDTTPPIITSITSNATSGILKVGDSILFTLTPNSTEVNAMINGAYNSQLLIWSTSDGGATYTATYTVSEGEPDQTTPIQITNVTITDATGNTSVQKNGTDVQSTIDANSLVITSITSNVASFDILKVGDSILFTLTPNPTEVNAMINGAYNSQSLIWSTSDGGATYTATYTVSEGESDQTTPIQITDVTITDAAGNTSVQKNGTDVQSTIDANSPKFLSAKTLSNSLIQITLDQDVIRSAANPVDFTLGGITGSSIDSITSITSIIFITLATGTTILEGDSVTISYTRSSGSFDDTSGNPLLNFAKDVTNNIDESPIITLTGANPQTIVLGDGYTELGAITNDGSQVTINSDAFSDIVGTYYIYYDSTDTAGNIATQVNRTVIVSATAPPIIILIGDNPQNIVFGSSYTELGATTNDGSLVTINSDAFRDIVGTYSIYYDSTNTSGTSAVQVVRTVHVINAPPPDCEPPTSGDWVITTSCIINSSAVIQGSVIVRDDSVLGIPSGVTLDIDFASFHLTVQSGSGVLIKSGGTVT